MAYRKEMVYKDGCENLIDRIRTRLKRNDQNKKILMLNMIAQGIRKEYTNTKAYQGTHCSSPEGAIFDDDKYLKIISVPVN